MPFCILTGVIMELSKTTQVDKNFISAVILAAGGSSRMGTDKIIAELCGVPVIAYSIKAMAESNADEIIVVASVSNVDRIKEIAKSVNSAKPVKIILGGKTRAESAVNAFNAMDERATVISVHDGARPLVLVSLCNEVAEKAAVQGGAIAAVWVKDTVKRVENGVITATPERKYLMQAQTPQAFTVEVYRKAIEYMESRSSEITDDASAAELAGCKVATVEGDYRNIKLTTPDDFLVAKAFLEKKDEM
jgi:2-C-methyl-D-erythritol 4-phosphate cytidylyltransferase/2-C-methyl-D-erythritol 4-phosphate cytidylyltransferase/2-C-methyl-D-erythritol 2,4-cyclodiphosphate synthase